MATNPAARSRIADSKTASMNACGLFGPRSAFALEQLADLNRAIREGATAGLPEYASAIPVFAFDDFGALFVESTIAPDKTIPRDSYLGKQMPAAQPDSAHWTERVVTQGHADYCAAYGHAKHTVDGIVQPYCPRCGDKLERWEDALMPAEPASQPDYRQPEGDEIEDALSPTLDELAADGLDVRQCAGHPSDFGGAPVFCVKDCDHIDVLRECPGCVDPDNAGHTFPCELAEVYAILDSAAEHGFRLGDRAGAQAALDAGYVVKLGGLEWLGGAR